MNCARWRKRFERYPVATEELLLSQPKESRGKRIRDLFAELGGGMGTAQFVHLCDEHGVWSVDDDARILFRGKQAEVRRELKSSFEGLPFAGITQEEDEDGSPVWQQRQLWTFADYELNIRELIGKRDDLDRNAAKLSAECEARYGRIPEITPLEDRTS